MCILSVPVGILLLASSLFAGLRDSDNLFVRFGSFLFMIPAAIFYAVYFRIIRRNMKADSEIENVCATFRSKFEVRGFSIRYNTKNTQICQERATVMRVIVFPPVPGDQESQTIEGGAGITNYDAGNTTSYDASTTNYDAGTTDDAGLNDRKAWGLE